MSRVYFVNQSIYLAEAFLLMLAISSLFFLPAWIEPNLFLATLRARLSKPDFNNSEIRRSYGAKPEISRITSRMAATRL
ncbi:hypothetical protein RB653_009922, partial [Dictyostelium firmibasis]